MAEAVIMSSRIIGHEGNRREAKSGARVVWDEEVEAPCL